MTSIKQRIFGISPDEVTFNRRGFNDGGDQVRRQLERVGLTFLQGYHTSLNDCAPKSLASRLDATEQEFRGFAYEGAALGLALLDQLCPWRRNRHCAFLRSAGGKHTYMVHVGFGWVIGRIPWMRWNIDRAIRRFDPVLRWLAVDGYGFSLLYFRGRDYSLSGRWLSKLHGYARHAFAQGMGRALWFVEGGDVDRIVDTLGNFPSLFRADLWSGIGLAATYAGGVDRTTLEHLHTLAGRHQAQLAQGAAFAAKARQRAGNETPHTDLACQVLSGVTSDAAARITDLTLRLLPDDAEVPAYEIWRRRIQTEFT